jgi:hypothetical protein
MQDEKIKQIESWGEVVELNETARQKAATPIVFHFRPTKFLKVAPDKLKHWEQFFVENVGLRPDRGLAEMWTNDPHQTISGSNGDWDDCDYW